jgi:hypothetical protein
MTTKFVTTASVPTSITVVPKVVLRRPPTETTEAQREKRLKKQAAANRITCRDNKNGTYTVTSQTRTHDGQRAGSYLVVPISAAWVCECQWHEHHPGGMCAHVAQVRAHRTRKGLSVDPVASDKSATEIMIERADSERRARGRTAYREEI